MHNNNRSQPVGGMPVEQDGLDPEELDTTEKKEIVNLATDIQTRISRHLPEMYDVTSACGEGQQGVMIDLRVHHFGNPISGAQLTITSAGDEEDIDRDEQAKELTQTLVAQTTFKLLQMDNDNTDVVGS